MTSRTPSIERGAPCDDGIVFPACYRDGWQDGYGACGWKLEVALSDPAIIACTAYTGKQVPTSVLVHDILDHLVSGFGLSGYRIFRRLSCSPLPPSSSVR